MKKDSLIGKWFGRLTVISKGEYIQLKNGKMSTWNCICDCGNKKNVRRSYLINNVTRSCGCLANELTVQRNRKIKSKENRYDLSGEFGVGWATNTGREFYFDLEDYDKIKDYCWTEHINSQGYSALETSISENKQTIRFSWIIGKKWYDHINRNPMDNRKCNLRKATNRENCINHSIRKDNSSGVTGVDFNNRSGKWVARISKEKNKRVVVYNGYSFNDAVKARMDAEKKYYGEFAPNSYEVTNDKI